MVFTPFSMADDADMVPKEQKSEEEISFLQAARILKFILLPDITRGVVRRRTLDS